MLTTYMYSNKDSEKYVQQEKIKLGRKTIVCYWIYLSLSGSNKTNKLLVQLWSFLICLFSKNTSWKHGKRAYVTVFSENIEIALRKWLFLAECWCWLNNHGSKGTVSRDKCIKRTTSYLKYLKLQILQTYNMYLFWTEKVRGAFFSHKIIIMWLL